MLAADFLEIKSLLDLCSAKLASWIAGKLVEENREFFGLKNDYIPEEETKIKEENMRVKKLGFESFMILIIFKKCLSMLIYILGKFLVII